MKNWKTPKASIKYWEILKGINIEIEKKRKEVCPNELER